MHSPYSKTLLKKHKITILQQRFIRVRNFVTGGDVSYISITAMTNAHFAETNTLGLILNSDLEQICNQ